MARMPPSAAPISQRSLKAWCPPPTTTSRFEWRSLSYAAAIRQVTIAHLRRALGFERSRAGFRGLKEAFPGVVSSTRVSG